MVFISKPLQPFWAHLSLLLQEVWTWKYRGRSRAGRRTAGLRIRGSAGCRIWLKTAKSRCVTGATVSLCVPPVMWFTVRLWFYMLHGLFPPDSDVLSWESSSWLKQRQEMSEHLCRGGLYQDSISRRFTVDEKNVLLQWSNLQALRWTPEQSADPTPPVGCPGYYLITILGKVCLMFLSFNVF